MEDKRTRLRIKELKAEKSLIKAKNEELLLRALLGFTNNWNIATSAGMSNVPTSVPALHTGKSETIGVAPLDAGLASGKSETIGVAPLVDALANGQMKKKGLEDLEDSGLFSGISDKTPIQCTED